MTREELQKAIGSTQFQIRKVEVQIEAEVNPHELRKLERYMKDLQYLQLWQIELWKRSREGE